MEKLNLKSRHQSGRGRHRGAIAAALVLLFVFTSLSACATRQLRMLASVEEQYPPASKCGKCHVKIFEEWKQSKHSKSYSNETFRHATNEHSFRDCLGCHAPVSIHDPGEPAVRSFARDEGVTCMSCHFNQGILSGPLDLSAAVMPHKVGIDEEFFKTSELCGTCHQGTFAEWRQADMQDKKHCQDCHMPEVTRKITQATGMTSKILVSMEEERQLRKHTFDYAGEGREEEAGPPDEHVAFEVGWRDETGGCAVDVVLVSKLPHLIPTGDFGFRKAVLVLRAKSKDGAELARMSAELYKEIKTALRPMERRTFHFSLPRETDRIELTLLRESRGESNRFVIAAAEFVKREQEK